MVLSRFRHALVLGSAVILALGGLVLGTALPAAAATAPPIPGYLQSDGTDTLTPVLSGVVDDSADMAVDGRIFLTDSSGTAIGGSPTAIGTVFSGERVVYHVPAGVLTDGDTYDWYMEACLQGTTTCSAATGTQTFTIDTAAAPPPPTANDSSTISGSSITGSDAIIDPGACSGADCALASNSALNVGGDGTNHWASALSFDLADSDIPANAIVTSATLDLTQSSCFGSCTGSDPWTGTLDIFPADTDVTSLATGPQLASSADPALLASGPGNQGSFDVTAAVQSWLSGGTPNDGLVLEADSDATATSGASYDSPQSNSSAPTLTVAYQDPTVPGAPTNVVVRAGDGGLEVNWNAPVNTGDSAGITGYTVTAMSSDPSHILTHASPNDGTWAILTGLTNSTAETVTVVATNAEGNSATSAAVTATPQAVSGTSTYLQVAEQFLTAQGEMNDGGAASADAADSGMAQAAAISDQLTAEQATDTGLASAMAADNTVWTGLQNSFSGALVIPGSSSVSVYLTGGMSATTYTDLGAANQDSFDTSSATDYRFTINGGSSAPELVNYVDADAAMSPVTEDADDSAASTSLDDDSGTTNPPGYSVPEGTNLSAGTETVAATKISLSGVADWAYNNARSNNDNGFHPDCTDFASRSLHFGGGDPETYETSVIAPPPSNHKDDHVWYGRWHGTYSSYSWGAAYHLAHHLNLVGSYWIKYWSNASRGDILFAHLGGSSFTGIDHAGVTTKMSNGMPFYSQHTPNQRNWPLTYWITHSKAGTTIWIASPAEH